MAQASCFSCAPCQELEPTPGFDIIVQSVPVSDTQVAVQFLTSETLMTAAFQIFCTLGKETQCLLDFCHWYEWSVDFAGRRYRHHGCSASFAEHCVPMRVSGKACDAPLAVEKKKRKEKAKTRPVHSLVLPETYKQNG